MMNLRSGWMCVLMLLAVLCGQAVAQPQVVYREIFPAGGQTIDDFGWKLYVGANAQDQSKSRGWGGGPGAGNLDPIASHAKKVDDAWRGFVWVSQGPRYVLLTSEAVFQRPVHSINWHMALRDEAQEVYVLVQVDINKTGRDELDPYYISAQPFRAGGEQVQNSSQLQVLVEESQWRRIALVPGSRLPELAQAEEARTLPEGPIVAIGFYAPRRTTNHVFDTVEVRAAGLEGGVGVAAGGVAQPIETRTPHNHRNRVDVSMVTGAQVDEAQVKKVIHLAPPGGGVDGDGSEGRPYRDVGKAFEAMFGSLREGVATKLLIADGLYRTRMPAMNFEQVGGEAVKTLLVIEGQSPDGVVFTGADVFATESFKPVTKNGKVVYYEAPWPHKFGLRGWNNGPHDLKTDIGHRSELLIYNGTVLRPVSLENYKVILSKQRGEKAQYDYQGLAEPEKVLLPGSFGVIERPENGPRVLIRLPEGATLQPTDVMEVSVRDSLMWLQFKENLVLRNLSFRHARNFHGAAAIHIGADLPGRWQVRNVLVERVNSDWNSGIGMKVIWNQGLTFRECRANYNGGGGITTGSIQNILWEDNVTNYNNWRGAWGRFVSWAFGGVKHHRMRDGIFRRHEAIGNYTRGFWFDIDHRNLLIEDVVCIGNIRGLFLEICPGPIEVRRALLANDTEVDLEIHANFDTLIRDSIIVGGNGTKGAAHMYAWKGRGSLVGAPLARALGVPNENIMFDRPGPYVLKDNVIGSLGTQPVFNLRGSERTITTEDYRGVNNMIFPAEARMTFKLGPEEGSLSAEQWVQKVNEKELKVMDPGFVDAANYDFTLKPDSPLRERKGELPLVKIDPAKIEAMKAFRAWVDQKATDGKEAGD